MNTCTSEKRANTCLCSKKVLSGFTERAKRAETMVNFEINRVGAEGGKREYMYS